MFLISKLLGLFTDPATVFLLLIMAGWLLGLSRRWRRVGHGIVGATLAIIVTLSIVPLDQWITGWMEDRFPAPAPLPERVDGIIVLGGAVLPEMSAARDQVAISGGASRVTNLIPLARLYPEARLIYTGGSGNPYDDTLREADFAERFYREMGFDTGRIVFERDSRNTRENATLSKAIMQPKPGETWLLITSAWHMPRAVGCFRAVGWPVLAYPTDYVTMGLSVPWWTQLRFDPPRGLSGLRPLIHEALGLVYYRLRGWTDELLPAP